MKRLLAVPILAFAILASGYLILSARSAKAQFAPDTTEIIQRGNKVGVVYVPDRDRTARKYVEHWVLFPGYVYPGDDEGTTEFRPAQEDYDSPRDFFRRVPFPAGSRYVLVRATESNRLPRR